MLGSVTRLVFARWQWAVVALLMLIGLGSSVATATDPTLVVGPNECAECHKKETVIWQHTHHFSTFRDLPNNPDAEKIASKMGVKRLKAESLCLNCHFTVQNVDGEDKAIAGISCESCHFVRQELDQGSFRIQRQEGRPGDRRGDRQHAGRIPKPPA